MLGGQPQRDKPYFVENEAIQQKIIKNIGYSKKYM